MSNRVFTAIFEEHDGWWIGHVVELPGANTQGETLDEARENLIDAIQMVLAEKMETSLQATHGRSIVREELSVAVAA